MSWIQTFTGRKVEPMSLVPQELDIRDIAHALANICRFGGHCRTFYSVAQHSVLASVHIFDGIEEPATPEGRASRLNDRRWALLHDAAEAYLGDIVRPLKPSVYGFKEAEERAHKAMAVRFGLWMEPSKAVKDIDEVLLATERRDLLTAVVPWDVELPEPLKDRIEPWTAEQAETQFLGHFAYLWGRAEWESGQGGAGGAASPPAGAIKSAQPSGSPVCPVCKWPLATTDSKVGPHPVKGECCNKNCNAYCTAPGVGTS